MNEPEGNGAHAPLAVTPGGVPVYCPHDELADPSTLMAHPRNPNRHPSKQIEAIVKVIKGTKGHPGNGWRNPVVVSLLSNRVTRGHGRLMAGKAMGDLVPVQRQAYRDEGEEMADMLADNRLSELSQIDEKMALEELLKVDPVAIEITGHTHDDIARMLASQSPRTRPEVEFSEELLLEHNYVVLYFDNPLDWQVAVAKFGLTNKRDLIPRKAQPTGIGRVLKGKEWLDRIQ